MALRDPEKRKAYNATYHKQHMQRMGLRDYLVYSALKRGGGTIAASSLNWPKHCPVLGILLDYDTPMGERGRAKPNSPSLDRWDNSLGYVKGNVFVISHRANMLKKDATAAELRALAAYAAHRPVV